jgi:molecular chaperone DnaK (HSP70)
VVEIQSAVNVDDTAVQQMVDESVEHAFEDLAARRWVEAKLKATELLKAARKGLGDCGEELDPAQRQEIQTSLTELEQAMSEDAQTQTGDLARLKAANAKVDEVTRPLAELMMDRAVAEMLRQQGVI